jgi:tRNA (cmo5U34)-methyltransferase
VRERGVHAQVKLHQGYVDELPPEPAFDAATLDLVLHFLPDDAGAGGKGDLLRQIARRLRPGAPLVLVDGHGAPGSAALAAQMDGWMRYCAMAGLSAEQVADYRGQVDASIHFVSEARLMELLAEAGFETPVPFYRFFVFGGWTAARR